MRKRLASARPSSTFAGDMRRIRRHAAEQERTLAQIARAVHAGNVRQASRAAFRLRELAGEANALLARLGLNECALRSSVMPL